MILEEGTSCCAGRNIWKIVTLGNTLETDDLPN